MDLHPRATGQWCSKASHHEMPTTVLTELRLTCSRSYDPRNQPDGSTSCSRVAATSVHVGGLSGIPGSWLQPGPHSPLGSETSVFSDLVCLPTNK